MITLLNDRMRGNYIVGKIINHHLKGKYEVSPTKRKPLLGVVHILRKGDLQIPPPPLMVMISRHFLPHYFSFAIESYIDETDFALGDHPPFHGKKHLDYLQISLI